MSILFDHITKEHNIFNDFINLYIFRVVWLLFKYVTTKSENDRIELSENLIIDEFNNRLIHFDELLENTPEGFAKEPYNIRGFKYKITHILSELSQNEIHKFFLFYKSYIAQLDAKGFNKGINFRYCLYLDSRDPTFSIGHVTSTITKENISIFQYIIDFTSNEFAKRYKSFKDEFFSIENDFRQGYLEPKQDKVTSDTNRKSFVLSDLNKPVLNQKQIAILFRLLWERRIIRNAELDKKPYSEIISNLTGYSKNTIRQDLSEKSITDLVRNPSDFDRIIEQLEKIISELKRHKRELE